VILKEGTDTSAHVTVDFFMLSCLFTGASLTLSQGHARIGSSWNWNVSELDTSTRVKREQQINIQAYLHTLSYIVMRPIV